MIDNPCNLSEMALSIIEERLPCWPGRLFAQVLSDELVCSRHLFSSPPVGTRLAIEPARTIEWMGDRVRSFFRIWTSFQAWASSDFAGCFSGKHVEQTATDIFKGFNGMIHIPADAPLESVTTITASSRRLAAIYRQAIEWSHSVRNADVHPTFREATYELSFFTDSLLRNIEGMPPALLDRITSYGDIAKARKEVQTVVPLTLNPNPPNIASFITRFTGIYERLQSGSAAVLGNAGYLYILTNPSLGNMIKIGKTKRDPRERITELSSATAIPTPFVLAFDAYVEDCDRAETYVHARLEKDGYRVAKNREFFNVDLTTAISAVLEAQSEERKRNERPSNGLGSSTTGPSNGIGSL